MRGLFYKLTGGRPMDHLRLAFRELWPGGYVREIHLYVDKFGRLWMAPGAWSLFRVRSMHDPSIWENNYREDEENHVES